MLFNIEKRKYMIKIGETQTLIILRETSIGVYLKDETDEDNTGVLLPKKQVPLDAEVGNKIDVFIYKDSEDRIIATTKVPKIKLGQIEMLEVVDTNKIGAFLDWGLEKDLFLPYKEQTMKVIKGKKYLVSLYIDKSQRLCASMKIYRFLKSDSDYKVNDKVTGILYSIKKDYGAFVAVDNKYHGLIANKEFYGNYKYGDKLQARVISITQDGKLNLSVRQPSYMQIDIDAQIILDKLKNYDEIYLNDSSSPEEIKKQLGMSKNSFKKALGKLLKNRQIEFTQNGIKKYKKEEI